MNQSYKIFQDIIINQKGLHNISQNTIEPILDNISSDTSESIIC